MTTHVRSLLFFVLAWLPLALVADPVGAAEAPGSVLSGSQRQQAATYRRDIGERHTDAASISRLLSMGEARHRLDELEYDEAVPRLERVVAVSPDDAAAWVALAVAQMLKREPNFPLASAAAANAYEAAEDDATRAVALGLLVEIGDRAASKQEPRRPWEPSPPLASVELDPTGDGGLATEARRLAGGRDLTAQLRAIVEEFPAALVPTAIEPSTESDLAGACVAFNRPLARPGSVRFEDYVEVRPPVRDLAVSASGKRLCVEGLAFGADATIVLKPGVPGRGDESLAEAVEMAVYVPDREPDVAFRERGYVLPAHGRQILPLKSVNVSQARVRVVRIVERNLAGRIGDSFLGDLGRWEIDQITEREGELVFEGTAQIDGGSNRSVTTGLALADLIGEPLQPGLYAVVVRDDLGEDSWEPESTQWLVVSNIGLSLFQGPDGLHVFARSLAGAEPLWGIRLTLVARNNRELATETTGPEGTALIPPAILSGTGGNEPLYLRAVREDGSEFTFLSLADSAFDLSDRGVAGREPAGAVDAYVFTERGIYRPGETVHAVALARRPDGTAWSDSPLTFRVLRPDGNEVRRDTVNDAGAGGHAIDIETSPSAMSGSWTLLAHIDPEAPPIGRTTFLVQDFVPPRIEVDASVAAETAVPFEPFDVELRADYLFGAPAAGLRATGEITLKVPEEPFPDWAGYRFGLEEEPWTPVRFPMSEATTDAEGRASIAGTVAAAPDTTHPLVAEAKIDVFEPGGRPRSVTVPVPFRHQDYVIGIRPQFEADQAPSDAPAAFEVVALDPDGTQRAASLDYVLWEEEWRFAWFRSGNDWDHQVIVDDRERARGTLTLDGSKPATVTESIGWGRYRLEVFDRETGIASSVRFRAGWGVAAAPDRPDMAEVTLDAERYEPGQTVRAFVRPPFEGRLLLLKAGRTLETIHDGPISAEGEEIEFELGDTPLPGGYLVATIFRPGEASSQRMPARAIGVAWLGIEHSDREMEVALDVPETIRPTRTLEVGVDLAGAGPQARLVVAAVDDAVLQVTGYESPDPAAHFFAQHRLGYEIRDIYGRLIDPYGAARAVVREGGDQAALNPGLTVRSTRVVSLFSGIVRPDENGRARVQLEVPEFAGRLRVMAVAWDGERVGDAETQVVVRDPVVADLGLPRFLAPGDVAEATLSLDNVEGPAGEHHVVVKVDGPLVLREDAMRTVMLEAGGSATLPVTLEAGGVGVGSMRVGIAGPGDFLVIRNWEIEVRPAQPRVAEAHYAELAPGESRTLDGKLVSGLLTGTESVRLSVGAVPDFRRAALLEQLDDYPYRCVEQTTSRAVAFLTAPAAEVEDRDAEIRAAIDRVIALQRSDGSFGFWSPWDYGGQWISAFVTDFLVRAAEEGFEVPQAPRERAIGWLRDSVRSGDVADEALAGYAYAHYLLAAAEAGELSRLRHFADVYGEALNSPMDMAMVSAALARYGDVERAGQAFRTALELEPDPKSWANYGSPLRDRAASVALLAEVATDLGRLMPEAREVAAAAATDPHLSTQEMSWLVRASTALEAQQQNFRLSVDGATLDRTEPYRADLTRAELTDGFTIANAGDEPIVYELAVSGVPGTMRPPEANGFRVERRILGREGQPIDLAALKQGDLVLVHLSGYGMEDGRHNALLVDMLPAGLEIEGGRLATEDLPEELRQMAEDTAEPAHVEARDDRFVAAWELEGDARFAIAYLARAVTPGSYVLPPTYIESMYQPELHGRGEAGRISITR